MASVKRLVTPTTDLSFDSVYAPFAQVPADRTFSPEVLGIQDPLTVQIRNAAFRVGKGEMIIDDAISKYGKIE
jgi:multiple sugar transport system substrate-binding protein